MPELLKIETIVVAEVKSYAAIKYTKFRGFEPNDKYDYVMTVISVLKGNKKLKEFQEHEYDGPESTLPIEAGLDCKHHGGFETGKKYLIFVGSVNDKARRQISGDDDPWLLEVKQKIKEQDEKHKKLLNKK